MARIDKVSIACKRLGMSQADLGEVTGKNRTAISRGGIDQQGG
ncbi:hypothetical protein TPL01_04060 [Sulfuriferula plumbiphila]|uniref:Uncharacterized protein n=1 Tax=Sulfuriferula plumbiphila TaxID=171865 RepID=A0A512L467_9PROT|nr:hypothetical protein SFPGR_28570 [Sulfuriferula plumbiphila]GEP29268.1 hypothetical protein TPL01_04060 [Sulfuriferula plumbiphila]